MFCVASSALGPRSISLAAEVSVLTFNLLAVEVLDARVNSLRSSCVCRLSARTI